MGLEEALKGIPGRLKELEKALGLNKTGISEKIGVSRSFYSNIVTGVQLPSFSFLVSLCHNCGVSAEWIIFGKGHMFTKDNEFISEIDSYWIDIIRDVVQLDPEKQLDFIEHMKTGVKLALNKKRDENS